MVLLSPIILTTFAAIFLESMTVDSTQMVILALGCNVDPGVNMLRIQTALAEYFPSLRFTDQVVTSAIGIVAQPFANCLACMLSDIDYSKLYSLVKNIEQELGSCVADKQAGTVVADIDILYCGGQKYHLADWTRPYIRNLIRLLPSDDAYREALNEAMLR